MNLNQLKTGIQGMAAVFGFSILLTACNNSDESANNSTTATGDKVGDTTATATVSADATIKAAKKRTGKVTTAAMTSDDPSMKIEKDKMGIYSRTEVAPAYIGGQASLEDYIVNNLQYPQDAIDNNVEGIVRVQFAVDEKGNVSNVSTIGNKLGYGLEEEAVKVVSSMPKWTPGQVKGKNVKTWRTLPINYQLES